MEGRPEWAGVSELSVCVQVTVETGAGENLLFWIKCLKNFKFKNDTT